MAKTILAPFTHARNFISAAAFAAANGFVPFGQTDDVKRAFDALQVKGFRKDNEFYQELLELGVVNSQVQVRQVMDLLEDVEFGKVLNRVGQDYNGLNTLMKALKKTQKFAQDAYTAEDDFWKIFTFLGEQRKLTDAYKAKGLQFGDDIVEVITDAEGRKFDRKIGVFTCFLFNRQRSYILVLPPKAPGPTTILTLLDISSCVVSVTGLFTSSSASLSDRYSLPVLRCFIVTSTLGL
jgi:hypothetical protein